MREPNSPLVELRTDRSGNLLYYVRLAPDALPPVRSSDLEQGWEISHAAAAAAAWGDPRLFRFDGGGGPLDVALTDADASCWAEAVDGRWSLRTPYGLSLCLRLLGLVTLLSESQALRALCPLSRAGAALDPALLRAAASLPLRSTGELDEARIRAHVAPVLATLVSGAEF